MAGFNGKNIIAAQGSVTISSTVPSPVFKIHAGDTEGLVIQINSASDPGSLTAESSLDGGASWYTLTSADLTTFSGGIRRYQISDDNMNVAGPLMRLKTANSVTATAIYVTVRG